MQFKVPQNIDLEDKIFGPLTLLQFLYLLIGGMVVYALFMAIPNKLIFILIAIPIAVTALSFAFMKVQDQPFSKFLGALLSFSTRPKSRIWHKEGLPMPIINPEQQIKTGLPKVHRKKISASELKKLAEVLDTSGRTNP